MPTIDLDGANGTVLTTTAEIVIATVAGVNTRPGSQVILHGFANLSAGAGTTSISLRWHRTSVAGPVVGGGATSPATAGVNNTFTLDNQDQPAESANATYVLTAQQNAATGNGAVTACNVRVDF